MTNPVTLAELRALREKATKGRWKCSGDGYSAIEDENGRTLYYDEGTATMENNELICALIEYFDLPSTQAMLDQAERMKVPPTEPDRAEHHYMNARAISYGWKCPGCGRCYESGHWQCESCVPSLKDLTNSS